MANIEEGEVTLLFLREVLAHHKHSSARSGVVGDTLRVVLRITREGGRAREIADAAGLAGKRRSDD